MNKVSIDATALPNRVTEEDAMEAFNEFMGTTADWKSGLVRYRMTSEFQRDWCIEVGHWILQARACGFEQDLRGRLNGARKNDRWDCPYCGTEKNSGNDLACPKCGACKSTRDPNDRAHSSLWQTMAEAMGVYYFVNTGWFFDAWNPKEPNAKDIDFSLRSPMGQRVAFQVGAPDRLGQMVNSRIVDGEKDKWVLQCLDKKAAQLPRPARMPAVVLLSAQRRLPLGSTPQVILPTAMGSTHSADYVDAPAWLDPSRRGKFASEWTHVGGIVLLDLRRGDSPDYMCTVLLNPWCEIAARCERTWFPHARILWLDGDMFRWKRGEPHGSKFPPGTVVMPDP